MVLRALRLLYLQVVEHRIARLLRAGDRAGLPDARLGGRDDDGRFGHVARWRPLAWRERSAAVAKAGNGVGVK